MRDVKSDGEIVSVSRDKWEVRRIQTPSLYLILHGRRMKGHLRPFTPTPQVKGHISP
jgi:hypothetical protein